MKFCDIVRSVSSRILTVWQSFFVFWKAHGMYLNIIGNFLWKLWGKTEEIMKKTDGNPLIQYNLRPQTSVNFQKIPRQLVLKYLQEYSTWDRVFGFLKSSWNVIVFAKMISTENLKNSWRNREENLQKSIYPKSGLPQNSIHFRQFSQYWLGDFSGYPLFISCWDCWNSSPRHHNIFAENLREIRKWSRKLVQFIENPKSVGQNVFSRAKCVASGCEPSAEIRAFPSPCYPQSAPKGRKFWGYLMSHAFSPL